MKADKTVAKPMELFDEIMTRLVKAQGICSLASLIPDSSEEIPDAALPNAMLAARDLMAEAEELAEKLHKLAAERSAHG